MPRPLVIVEPNKRPYWQIVQVGCGANGSHFFRGLCQLLRTHTNAYDGYDRVPFSVELTLVDADVVEKKNLSNQLFDSEDISLPKAEALADRYGEVYNLSVKRVVEFVKDLDMLKLLFAVPEVSKKTDIVPILVGMVDNNRSRQLFDEYFYSDEVEDLIWIDAGVEGVEVLDKPKHALTPEDEQLIANSGFGGQVVCGVKRRGKVILEPVTRVYPNILEDTRTSFPGESCGDLVVNNPQRLATNRMAAELGVCQDSCRELMKIR
ncbi:ThiF family adenylyltransferase [Brevibacillus sp. 179-C9.3 HS]|uniref:ThiF family adenylyltransferase n=1 Tax=unclassified Brevibacillus TaxID=2684853 RepID=UPI0039A3EBE6